MWGDWDKKASDLVALKLDTVLDVVKVDQNIDTESLRQNC